MPCQHCLNFADIAQGRYRANTEQADKIVWNKHTQELFELSKAGQERVKIM